MESKRCSSDVRTLGGEGEELGAEALEVVDVTRLAHDEQQQQHRVAVTHRALDAHVRLLVVCGVNNNSGNTAVSQTHTVLLTQCMALPAAYCT